MTALSSSSASLTADVSTPSLDTSTQDPYWVEISASGIFLSLLALATVLISQPPCTSLLYRLNLTMSGKPRPPSASPHYCFFFDLISIIHYLDLCLFHGNTIYTTLSSSLPTTATLHTTSTLIRKSIKHSLKTLPPCNGFSLSSRKTVLQIFEKARPYDA